ncbi:MAG: PAS domain-containing sensor histidine kinase [Alphaproteobacteria bacterium]|nr:PAS domain-containing sensor histidine kinase [Alphaproteobacteria bacterium]
MAAGELTFARIAAWGRRVKFHRRLTVVLLAAVIAAAMVTYAALADVLPFRLDASAMTALLILDVFLLLLITVMAGTKIWKLIQIRRQNKAGSRLHVRLVSVFALFVASSLVVAVFAALFFYFGVQAWFSDKVSTAINESLAVAEAYMKEHQQNIRADALDLANILDREAVRLKLYPELMNQLIDAQANARNLSEAVVFDSDGRIVARSRWSYAISFEPLTELVGKANQGDVVLVVSSDAERIRALVRLENYPDTYLFVGRFVEPQVLAHMATTQDAVRQYSQLEGRRSDLQITITMIFLIVAALLLMAAVWFGLNFASRLVRPISELMAAAERVRGGDLSARVPLNTDDETDDELLLLGRAFNRMTEQLDTQREDLVAANRLIDRRRRFTEAVLSSVPAGVMGVDQRGHITLINQMALQLLGLPEADKVVGRPVADIFPEIHEMAASLSRTQRVRESQIEVTKKSDNEMSLGKTFFIRMAADVTDHELRGYVVTLDDLSELQSAQRKAAWADVARRIAHEIKNPLTPIQLAAERLNRKYLSEISSDPETFTRLTDTIVRQVDELRRMVEEFSAFARMPQPMMQPADLRQLCQDVGVLYAHSNTHIAIRLDMPETPVMMSLDRGQISQVLNNLIKNAMEATEARLQDQPQPQGQIVVSLRHTPQQEIVLTVSDNGKGLPKEDRERLTEPYVTTRAKGTGLGLAIVKKIVEDHSGRLILGDDPSGGARVEIRFNDAMLAAA